MRDTPAEHISESRIPSASPVPAEPDDHLDRFLAALGPLLREHSARSAWLVGSRARGNAVPESDIDVIIDSGAEADRWLKQAENDLDFARVGLREGFFAQVCFLAQQSAESTGAGCGTEPPGSARRSNPSVARDEVREADSWGTAGLKRR